MPFELTINVNQLAGGPGVLRALRLREVKLSEPICICEKPEIWALSERSGRLPASRAYGQDDDSEGHTGGTNRQGRGDRPPLRSGTTTATSKMVVIDPDGNGYAGRIRSSSPV